MNNPFYIWLERNKNSCCCCIGGRGGNCFTDLMFDKVTQLTWNSVQSALCWRYFLLRLIRKCYILSHLFPQNSYVKYPKLWHSLPKIIARTFNWYSVWVWRDFLSWCSLRSQWYWSSFYVKWKKNMKHFERCIVCACWDEEWRRWGIHTI